MEAVNWARVLRTRFITEWSLTLFCSEADQHRILGRTPTDLRLWLPCSQPCSPSLGETVWDCYCLCPLHGPFSTLQLPSLMVTIWASWIFRLVVLHTEEWGGAKADVLSCLWSRKGGGRRVRVVVGTAFRVRITCTYHTDAALFHSPCSWVPASFSLCFTSFCFSWEWPII